MKQTYEYDIVIPARARTQCVGISYDAQSMRLAPRADPGGAPFWYMMATSAKSAVRDIFDAYWYRRQLSRRPLPWTNLLRHYVREGVHKGLDPNPYFSTAWYVEKYAEAQEVGINPLLHYATRGFPRGFDPSDHFSTRWYLLENPDVRRECINPLLHYLKHGIFEGRLPVRPSGVKPYRDRNLSDPASLFDHEWYGRKYPEAGALDEESRYQHYVQVGARREHDPNPFFSAAWYCAALPGGLGDHPNALSHYFYTGASSGINPSPLFHTKWYMSVNPDVAAHGYNPLSHFLLYGQKGSEHPHPAFLDPGGGLLTGPCVRYMTVPINFDPSDIVGMLSGYASCTDLLAGRHARSFMQRDFVSWVIMRTRTLNLQCDADSSPRDVAIISGVAGFVADGSLVRSAHGMSGGDQTVSRAAIIRVSYNVKPFMDRVLSLFTDAAAPMADRVNAVSARLQDGHALRGDAIVVVEDDLPEDTYVFIRAALGAQRQVIRVPLGVMCRVKCLDAPPF